MDNTIDIPFDEFIKNIIDKRPSNIYNYKTVNIFIFHLKSTNGSLTPIRTEYHLTSFDEDITETFLEIYDTETFLKKINVDMRRKKILKLKEKWKGYR